MAMDRQENRISNNIWVIAFAICFSYLLGTDGKRINTFLLPLPAFVVMGLSLLIIHLRQKRLRYYYTIIALD